MTETAAAKTKGKPKESLLLVMKDGKPEFWRPSFVTRARWVDEKDTRVLVLNDGPNAAPESAAAWCEALGIEDRSAGESLADAFDDDKAE